MERTVLRELQAHKDPLVLLVLPVLKVRQVYQTFLVQKALKVLLVPLELVDQHMKTLLLKVIQTLWKTGSLAL
jgi:hypothetical protein